ncbi:thioredoxin family protein [Candidatus Fermentibacteria bacterium]|nr:thioredoxin family protein [Candidatus Fermentibacteria bacterium]
MRDIKVLGTGCPKCLKLTENVSQALERAGLQGVTVEKVSDIKDIMKFGVMMTPALVVDGEVRVMGRVPGVDELVTILTERR